MNNNNKDYDNNRNRGLFRLKPCALISLLLAVILLILACITVNRACYDSPNKYQYEQVTDAQTDSRFLRDCRYFCDSPAVKLIGTPTTAARTDNFQFPNGRVARCPWEHVGRHLFLALTSLMVLWFAIELWLSSARRFHPCWNLVGLLVLGLSIPTAIYLINDLYNTDCGPWENRGFLCYSTIFNVSFILLICCMVAMLFNLIQNIIRRRHLHNKDAKAARNQDIPQQAVITDAVIVNEAPIVGYVAPGSGLGAPVSGLGIQPINPDERIS